MVKGKSKVYAIYSYIEINLVIIAMETLWSTLPALREKYAFFVTSNNLYAEVNY